MASRGREQEHGVPLDYLQQLYANYQLLIGEMRRRGVRVLTLDWREFGPPVEIWKRIREMASSSDHWYEELSFSLTKIPRMPLVPSPEAAPAVQRPK
jgi:hypothetical protein